MSTAQAPPPGSSAPEPGPEWQVPPQRGAGRWIKALVTLLLYALVFYWTDVRVIVSRLTTVRLEYVAVAVLLYVGGQALSTWKWRLLLAPVGLAAVRYPRLLAFYFIGMFFNLFLPTMVGGDAVKAVLLARETGAPVRATTSVFMERNLGLSALLSIALVASWRAPAFDMMGVPLSTLTLLLFCGFIAANVALVTRGVYGLVDRIIAATPLARMRHRAAPLYDAVYAYRARPGVIASTVLLSFVFQGVVIAVVFLNTRALQLDFPFSSIAVFVPLISLASMIPVSVNGLGVREALYIFFFGRLGAPTEVSVSLALLYLAVTFMASLPGGLVYASQRSGRPQPTAASRAPRS
jgi:glycosyltransferase 2 family protein